MEKNKPSILLGVSAFYHNSAAALIIDGVVVAAAEEERFSRIKNDSGFPKQSISYLLKANHLHLSDVDCFIYYEKPFLKFERIFKSIIQHAPFSFSHFFSTINLWAGSKLLFEKFLNKQLNQIEKGKYRSKIKFSEHHLSHAAHTYFLSGFKTSFIIINDGVGELATTTLAIGRNNSIEIINEIHYPHSIGLLYSAFTRFLGFKVNSGEYKLMGLSGYGSRTAEETEKFIGIIKNKLITIYQDGSYKLNLKYFRYTYKSDMISFAQWEKLFELAAPINTHYTFSHCNLALAIQLVIEEILLLQSHYLKSLDSSISSLCLGGGVSLNCVANGKLLEENLFDTVYVPTACGDSGAAIGAALSYHFACHPTAKNDTNITPYLGFNIQSDDCLRVLDELKIKANYLGESDSAALQLAELLNENAIIAICNGKEEFGPRALGNRSLLADPRAINNKLRLNKNVKKREAFRPFAPIILEEEFSNYFYATQPTPTMSFVYKLKNEFRTNSDQSFENLNERIVNTNSQFPAITHADFSSRVQTINQNQNLFVYQVLKQFHALTNCPMLINTSFNERGEPLVSNAFDAISAFVACDIDYLFLGGYLISRTAVQHLSISQFNRNFEAD